MTKNAHGQLAYSTSTPPRIGPPASETADTAPKTPNAIDSFSGGNAARSTASPAGASSAANVAWSTRAPINIPIEEDSPQSREASAKPAVPTRNAFL